jgi:hypothetical protein
MFCRRISKNTSFPLRLSQVYGKKVRRNILVLSRLLLVFGFLVTLIGSALLIRNISYADDQPVYVGIDVGFGDEETVYKIADAFEGYVNLIVLGSLNVTTDTTTLSRVCDYLYQRDFTFIVFVAFTVVSTQPPYLPPNGPDAQFFLESKERWGDKLLGAYVFDEAGGKYIDLIAKTEFPNLTNYSEAAKAFITHTGYFLSDYSDYYGSPNLTRYTSDYALYWYDYLAGYDVVFGEFVGNQSRQLAVALCRGAAKSLGKNWGTMITWKYDQPPFVEGPLQLFQDMVLAYKNGAKYIIVFNSPGNNSATTEYGILTCAHLCVIKAFWCYTQLCPPSEEFPAETVYVLPSDYGYGFRGSADMIWGAFGPDALSPVIWNATNSFIQKYGTKLDIVYETKTDSVPVTLPYKRLIYWNGTIIER